MSNKKMPTEWQERPISKWNAATFRLYLADKHRDLYGIDYVARNYAMEAKLIRTMIDAHGTELTRSFIDACFDDYRPTPQYPGINFAFMYTFMRDRILPRLLAEAKQKEARSQSDKQAEANEMGIEDIKAWL